MNEVQTVKELKALGPAPEGHIYTGSSLAYWCFDKESAFAVYDYCKWESSGKKQQVIVQCAPDVDSLRITQGHGATWKIEDHPDEDCPHCGIVYQRIKK